MSVVPGSTLASTPELVISRVFFNAAVSLVWREVAEAHNILNLSPYIVIVQPISGSIKEIEIIMNRALVQTRLNVYAPFVQHLDILPWGVDDYRVRGLNWLFHHSVQTPLLPNLKSLSMGKFASGGFNQILWIKAFFSPSLTSIAIDLRSAPPQQIPEISAATILKCVRANCPAFQRLDLFHDNAEPSDSRDLNSGWFHATHFHPRVQFSFYETLSGFQLRELGCSMEILHPGSVGVLSTLSALESLRLFPVDDHDYEYEDSLSFQLPTLKHLGLHYAAPCDIDYVNKLGLLSSLESFEFVFMANYPEITEEWNEGWESDLITSICQNSRSLKRLTIDAGVVDFLLPTALAEVTATLPLTDVCLKGSVLGTLSDVANFWPKVSRFSWDISCGFADLSQLTGQSSLQHLALKLQGSTNGLRLYAGSPTLPDLQTFELLGWPFTVGPDPKLAVQHLLSMWPKLTEIAWSPPEIRRVDSAKLAKPMLKFKVLKDFLLVRRDLERLKSGIIKEYGKNVLDEILG
ncbi:hypothetical protein RhiJN_25514 [Ceratobasidium sp. AG-Ba]|nr:hypothetical protein RhiJN_25514 [Ceratobasidium sp. AG-Ba]